MKYLFMHEQLYAERSRELQSEIEQIQRANQAAGHAPSLGRHAVGQLGKALVSLGTWLEHAEQHDEMTRPAGQLRYPEYGS